MGGCLSTASAAKGFYAIADKYETMEQVQQALQKEGLESSDLIVGIDFTKSNLWQGKKTFNGHCLHEVDPTGRVQNPYQETIDIIGRTLAVFDDDGAIPAFGFGDSTTGGKSVFALNGNNKDPMCKGFDGVLEEYNRVAPRVNLAGPTTFAPLIDKAVEIVKEEGSYHILLIICDGAVSNMKRDAAAIARANKVPLSIVCVGVGDGPWDAMEEFDDKIPARSWDNFQFVNWHEIKTYTRGRSKASREAAFALAALMEIPEQFKICKKRGLIEKVENEADLYGESSLRQKGAYHSSEIVLEEYKEGQLPRYEPGRKYSAEPTMAGI